MTYTDELLIERLTRIADSLEQIANTLRIQLNQEPIKSPTVTVNTKEEYVDDKKAAEISGLSRAWFQRKRVEGGGPPYTKLAGAIRYRVADLHAWFTLHRVQNTSEWTERKRKLEL